ncbi:MAG: DNA-directed RNA polymerase subunit H [Candidatus Diapherotrites archaeon]|nr:DNA-directed RNA polymerase subunit H [Candidatus Diapherotrites archaeon]
MLEADFILKHSLVPKHEVMSDTSVERLFKKYKLSKDQLPRIKNTDPVVDAIGAKKGQVLKISRDSITAGKAVTYRIVV